MGTLVSLAMISPGDCSLFVTEEAFRPKTDPYLFFNGNCAEAMQFYEKVLGGKLDLMRVGDTPAENRPPGADGNRVMHAHLAYDGGPIMASDWLDASPFPGMHGFGVSLSYESAADAKRVFDALAGGRKPSMPAGPTFWAEFFGMVEDRFGTPWMVTGGPKM